MNPKVRKYITAGTLMGLGVCTLMLILSIFGLSFFEGVKLSILITIASFTVGGYFSISSYYMLEKHKIFGILSFVFIWLSVLLVSISSWVEFSTLMVDITITISLFSVLFNFIVSNNLKLGKNYIVIQIVCDVIICIFVLLIILFSYEIVAFKSVVTLFWLLLILSLVSLILMTILSRKGQIDTIDDKDFVKISRKEYEELLNKAKELEDLKKVK